MWSIYKKHLHLCAVKSFCWHNICHLLADLLCEICISFFPPLYEIVSTNRCSRKHLLCTNCSWTSRVQYQEVYKCGHFNFLTVSGRYSYHQHTLLMKAIRGLFYFIRRHYCLGDVRRKLLAWIFQ